MATTPKLTSADLRDVLAAEEYQKVSIEEVRQYWTPDEVENAMRGLRILKTHQVLRVREYAHHRPKETELGPWDYIAGRDGFWTYLILAPKV